MADRQLSDFAGTGISWDALNEELDVDYGSSAGTACEGNDSRLSNARTPTSHASTHAPGQADAIATGTSSSTVCIGNDSRLSDSRAPTGSAGGDLGGTYPNPTVAAITETSGPTKLTFGTVAANGFLRRVGTAIQTVLFGTSSGTVCDGGDSRLSDARTPTTHASSHLPGGADALTTAAASANPPGTSSAAGSAASFARSDHTHALAAFGSSSGTFCQGNDSRLTDSRAPNGSAGGDLSGSYPNPAVAKITTTSGPTSLTIGAIADTNLIRRNGTSFEGIAATSSAVGLGNVTNDAQLTRGANDFASFSGKGSPVSGDLILIEDSAAGGAKKYVDIGNLPGGGGGGGAALSDDDPAEVVPGGAADPGAAADASRADHVHALADFGTGSGEFCEGNDSRLSDDRTASGIRTATTVVAVSSSTAPSSGQVLLASSTTAAAWSTPTSSTVGLGSVTNDAQLKRASGDFSSFSNKASPTTSDVLLIEDAAASGAKKYITISALPAAAPASHASTHAPGQADAIATGTSSSTVCIGNDSRLSDSRAPTGSAGGDLGGTYPNPTVAKLTTTSGPTALTIGAITDGQVLIRTSTTVVGATIGSGSGTICAGNDSRLSDSRTPTTHASSHLPGGSDALTTASASANPPGTSSAAGSAASFARSDHTHALAAFGTSSGTFCEGNDSRVTSALNQAAVLRLMTLRVL